MHRDTVALWHKVSTVGDPEWSRRYLADDPGEKAFGGRVEITLRDGSSIIAVNAVPDVHPLGAPSRARYEQRSRTLASEALDDGEIERFLATARRMPQLSSRECGALHNTARPGLLDKFPMQEGLI